MRATMVRWSRILLALAGFLVAGCVRSPRPAPAAARPIARLGYTLQVGAFAQVENAVRLSEALQSRGLEATYYASSQGLYRVRFGDFPDKEAARLRAEALVAAGTIQEYYVVSPESPALRPGEDAALRDRLVETARSYLGVPYLWGGASPSGFDCSGLTMSVYRLNGLRLPRSSRDQYESGSAVAPDRLQQGDLLFFATAGGSRVSHVGLYAGNGTFIHAPGRGKSICEARITDAYFRRTFVGARSYF